jgi:hypothetical protein
MSTQQVQQHTRGNTERSIMARLIKQTMGVSVSLYQKMWVNETQFGWSVTLKRPHHLLDLNAIAQRFQKANAFVNYHVATQKKDDTANIKFYSKALYPSAPVNHNLIPDIPAKVNSRPGTTMRATYRNVIQNIVQLRPTQYSSNDAYTRGSNWVVVYYNVSGVSAENITERMDKSIFADSYVLEQNANKFYLVLLGENNKSTAKISTPVSAKPEKPVEEPVAVVEAAPVASNGGIDYPGLTQSLIEAIKTGAMSYESFASHSAAVYELLGGDLSLTDSSIGLLQALGKKVVISIK